MVRRALLITASAFLVWLGVLLILGYVLGSRQERGTASRLADSLQAKVAIGESDLALVRGRWEFEDLSVRRDDVMGHLAISVAEVRCELGPLGWALIDRDCGELAIRGTRLEVSSTALFKVRAPKRRPIHADRLVIDDAVLVFLPSAIAPSLGRVEITIEHAESGPTILRTPLSWLFSVRELAARFVIGDVTLQLTYKRGVLSATSTLFGAPVELPIQLPIVQLARDGHEEIQMLVKLGKDIAQELVARRAADWLKAKLDSGSASSPAQ